MKKTYFAPTCEAIALHSYSILANSERLGTNEDKDAIDNAGWSKGFAGSFWDDGSADKNKTWE